MVGVAGKGRGGRGRGYFDLFNEDDMNKLELLHRWMAQKVKR